jgi:hypothetical protein
MKYKNLFIFLAILILAFVILMLWNSTLTVSHFEDGSGILSIKYCLPWSACGL